MFSFANFFSISLNHEQVYKLIEYTALNLCTEKEIKWWKEAGCIVQENEYLIGTPSLISKLNELWWNLVTIDNYNIEYGNGPITQNEINEKRKEFPMMQEDIEKIKRYIKIS